MMDSLPELKAGVYRHYKGPLYLVLGYAHDANAEPMSCDSAHPSFSVYHPGGHPNERVVVVYVGLQLDDARSDVRMHVRTTSDFLAEVHLDNPTRPHLLDGTACEGSCHYARLNTDGSNLHKVVRRFEYTGPVVSLS